MNVMAPRAGEKITFTEKLFILKVQTGSHIVSRLFPNLISLIRTVEFWNSISTFIGRKGQNTLEMCWSLW